MVEQLKTIQGVVLDMDGVVYRGTSALPGVADLFAFFRKHAIPFALATNNSGRLPSEYVQRLANIDVPDVDEAQIVSSGTATVDVLRDEYPQGTRVYVIGMPGLKQLIRDAGFDVLDHDDVDDLGHDEVELVVAGIDFDFNYRKARTATLLIRNGAAFIGTNPDVTFPAPVGLMPGAGSIVGMIELATGVTPRIIGKPERAMFDVALAHMGVNAQHALMIGDRLNTDILGAQGVGMQTALVFTGVTDHDELEASDIQPDFVYDDLTQLLSDWQNMLG